MKFVTLWWRSYPQDDVQRMEPFCKGVMCSVEVESNPVNRFALTCFFARYADEHARRTCQPVIMRSANR